MIKYYAYYNHGGYKDFYLGSQEEDVKSKYFLPLLTVHELSLSENPDDAELRNQIEHQRSLPKLIALSDKTIEYNYPKQARTLMSHGGYKVLYRSIGCSQYVLAIRDIAGSKDIYGRQTPFNMMLIGDDQKDLKEMDIIAEYIRNNISSFESAVGSIFIDDIKENGLRCDIGKLRDKLNEIIENGSPLIIDGNMKPSVRMLVIPNISMLNSAIKEQNIDRDDIYICYKSDGSTLFTMPNQNQDKSSNFNPKTQQSTISPTMSSPIDKQPAPSLHAILNVPKREDIEQLWMYIKELEKRIVELENRINHE